MNGGAHRIGGGGGGGSGSGGGGVGGVDGEYLRHNVHKYPQST